MAVTNVNYDTVLTQQQKTNAASGKLADDFSQFLTLLTIQLQNQDPLSPMDTTEFTNQLVAFSGVEQQINTNQKLDALVAMQLSNALSGAQSYVGKNVSYVSTEFEYTGVPADIKYSMPVEAASSKIDILDEAGDVVYSIDGEKVAGAHNFVWDGSTKTGGKAAAGTYEFRVTAFDENDEKLEVTSVVNGRVRGTEVQNGQVFLLVGARAVGLDTVINTSTTNIGNNDGLTMALSYVGLDVTYNNNEVLFSGSPVSMDYELADDAEQSRYIVKNSTGQIVYTGTASTEEGSHTLIWNGQTNAGGTAPAGEYTIEIAALDENDNEIATKTIGNGRVTGVETKNGELCLVVNGKSIPIFDILSAGVPEDS
jgi:flagellar basal-body rod modification protein FlgD